MMQIILLIIGLTFFKLICLWKIKAKKPCYEIMICLCHWNQNQMIFSASLEEHIFQITDCDKLEYIHNIHELVENQ